MLHGSVIKDFNPWEQVNAENKIGFQKSRNGNLIQIRICSNGNIEFSVKSVIRKIVFTWNKNIKNNIRCIGCMKSYDLFADSELECDLKSRHAGLLLPILYDEFNEIPKDVVTSLEEAITTLYYYFGEQV